MKLYFWQYRLYFGRRLISKGHNVCTLADEREDGVIVCRARCVVPEMKVRCGRDEGANRSMFVEVQVKSKISVDK